jgi:predicted Zn-dependent peptidase
MPPPFFLRSYFRRSFILTLLLALAGGGCVRIPGQQYIIAQVEDFEVDGIRVLLQSTPESKFVSTTIFFDGGIAQTPEPYSVALEKMSLDILLQTGPSFLSRAYYRRRMNEGDFPLRSGNTRDYSYLQAYSLRERFDTAWAYLASMIVDPHIDERIFEGERARSLMSLQTVKNDPATYSEHIAEVLFFSKHAYGRLETESDISDLGTADLIEHCKRLFVRSRMLICACGNITKDELIQKLRSYHLNRLPEGKKFDRDIYLPIAATSPFIAFHQFKRKIPTNYILGYCIAPSPTAPYYSAFQNAFKILKGGLFYELRVKSALSYAPKATYSEGRISYAVISFQTESPGNAMNLLWDIVNKLKILYYPTNPREGTRNRNSTIAYLQQQNVSERSLALGKAQLIRGNWRRALEEYDFDRSLSPKDVQQAATIYLNSISWVFVGDTSKVDRGMFQPK